MRIMRKCGFSDKMFYYNGAGAETFSMRLRYEFSLTLSQSMVEEAAEKTFACFPEYKVRPVLKDGKAFYEENTLPIPVFWNEPEGANHFYGSDQVNGYLFVISGEEHALTFSLYHGLTDFVGYWRMFHTLMKNLMEAAGVHADDPQARSDSAPYEAMDKLERENPYSKYADENAYTNWNYKSRGALAIPKKGEPKERFFDLVVPEHDFLMKTREFGTSFVPLLAMVFSWAANDIYGIGAVPVVSKVPVNLRPLFNSNTPVNLSDSAVLEFPREYLSLSPTEQGKALRAQLDKQLDAGNFQRVMAKKIKTIESYEQSGKSMEEIGRSILENAHLNSRPVTLGLTYPGRLLLPEAYLERIKDINICAYTPTDGIFATAMAYGGRLKLRIQVKYENTDFIGALENAMKKLGLETSVSESALDLRDIMDVKRLKIVP